MQITDKEKISKQDIHENENKSVATSKFHFYETE